MTSGGRWPSWGERREVSPLVLRNSHPLSPQAFFQKSPLPPAPTCLCCWEPIRAGGVWGLAAVGLFSGDGIESLWDKTASPMVPNTLCFVLLLCFGFVTQPGLIKHGGFSCC